MGSSGMLTPGNHLVPEMWNVISLVGKEAEVASVDTNSWSSTRRFQKVGKNGGTCRRLTVSCLLQSVHEFMSTICRCSRGVSHQAGEHLVKNI